ncbi:antifungal defensin [Fusarium flagelliforme]|uniref:Antifungal defensin n=1 Tax=Fusarium flagelliforme TaxID=2675880 RepID=A0A395N059_9HYPO|nr:antifungal defensin [Fusarium flagelliforme]
MLFNKLFLSAVLAMSSVAALPNPMPDQAGIAERSPKSHDHHHHCGKHASYSEDKKECVCHDSSETFEKKHKKCKKMKDDKKAVKTDVKKAAKDVKKKTDDKKDDDKKGDHKDDKKDTKPKSERDLEERSPKKHHKGKHHKDHKDHHHDDKKKHHDERDIEERDIEERTPKKHHKGKHHKDHHHDDKKKHHDERTPKSTRSLLHHCGKSAYYDKAKKECICHDSGKDFYAKHKTCSCPKGEKWHHIERKCKK